MKHAVVKLLQDQLGLEVLVGQGRVPAGGSDVDRSRSGAGSSEKKASFRRPEDMGMLRVTRESLQRWLQSRQ